MTEHIPAVVVGGGISGLVCAYALRKAGVEMLLLESSSRTGGVIRSERRGDFLIEMGPQSFSGSGPLRNLCSELGIEKEIVQAPSAAPRYVVVMGKLRQVPLSPPKLFTSSLLGARTKLRLVHDAFGTSRPPAADESIASFVRRKFTAELLDRLVGPFVSGVYAGDPERLSLRSAFPQVYEAERSAGSVIRGVKRVKTSGTPEERPTLLSFRQGSDTLIGALTEKLEDRIRTETQVLSVAKDRTTEVLELTIQSRGEEESIKADSLVLATPTNAAGHLLRDIDPEFGTLMEGIEYASVAVLSLGYRRNDVGHALDGFGFLAPRSSGLRTLGTVWNSSLFPGRAPAEHVLLTSFIGGATDPEAASLSSTELVALVHKEIAPLLTIRQVPVFSSVMTYPRALPQYNLGHAQRLAEIEELRSTSIPNLWLAGNYLKGPSIGTCVEQALAVAEEVCSHLKR